MAGPNHVWMYQKWGKRRKRKEEKLLGHKKRRRQDRLEKEELEKSQVKGSTATFKAVDED